MATQLKQSQTTRKLSKAELTARAQAALKAAQPPVVNTRADRKAAREKLNETVNQIEADAKQKTTAPAPTTKIDPGTEKVLKDIKTLSGTNTPAKVEPTIPPEIEATLKGLPADVADTLRKSYLAAQKPGKKAAEPKPVKEKAPKPLTLAEKIATDTSLITADEYKSLMKKNQFIMWSGDQVDWNEEVWTQEHFILPLVGWKSADPMAKFVVITRSGIVLSDPRKPFENRWQALKWFAEWSLAGRPAIDAEYWLTPEEKAAKAKAKADAEAAQKAAAKAQAEADAKAAKTAKKPAKK